MQAMINFMIIFLIAAPAAALIYIIKSFRDISKTRKQTQERLMDIITEYEIKNNSGDEK